MILSGDTKAKEKSQQSFGNEKCHLVYLFIFQIP